jgi:SAM-dependent methyltransferase
MSSQTATAAGAYDALAPYYDEFTADYGHDRWVVRLEALARAHGLRGRRLLDVACGTGKSFEPMLARGYEVTACDISPEMVQHARGRLPGAPDRVFVADMRSLPFLGGFDLVTCLDDAVNYLLSARELTAAFRGVARCLRREGVFIFDVNSLATYRKSFAEEFVVETPDAVFRWRGEAPTDVPPGRICTATIEVRGDMPAPVTSRHVQRHHPEREVRGALWAAGLQCVAVYGNVGEGRLTPQADESRHSKIVYVARRRRRRSSRVTREGGERCRGRPFRSSAGSAHGRSVAGDGDLRRRRRPPSAMK